MVCLGPYGGSPSVQGRRAPVAACSCARGPRKPKLVSGRVRAPAVEVGVAWRVTTGLLLQGGERVQDGVGRAGLRVVGILSLRPQHYPANDGTLAHPLPVP